MSVSFLAEVFYNVNYVNVNYSVKNSTVDCELRTSSIKLVGIRPDCPEMINMINIYCFFVFFISVIMKQFDHQHIIKLVGICSDRPVMIVMELAKHGELR